MLYCEGCGQLFTEMFKKLFELINTKGMNILSETERTFLIDALQSKKQLTCPECGNIQTPE